MHGRGPSLGHSYLAFLVRLLGVKTILTFNFDELIERSLEREGVRPRVFAMEEGRGLPHQALVRDVVSVVKLHGSNHALLVDERLDHPLSSSYKERFDRLVGPDPLLLVIGCSGEDYRLRDLVEHVARRSADAGGSDATRIAWLHFEPMRPHFLPPPPRALTALANNPGVTLMHCYTALTGRHPASQVPYLAHMERPVPLGKARSPQAVQRAGVSPGDRGVVGGGHFEGEALLYQHGPHSKPPFKLAVVSQWDGDNSAGDTKIVEPDLFPRRSASEALVDAANYWLNKGYQTIWVDLESVHTLGGVVGVILDQCRRYDVSVAPSVLPSGDRAENEPLKEDDSDGTPDSPRTMKTVVQAAVRRVAHCLQRTRYFVAFDGLETYLWPPLSHHGDTRTSEKQAAFRLPWLIAFFDDLAEVKLGDSMICVGIDPPKNRSSHNGGPKQLEKLIEYVASVKGKAERSKGTYVVVKLAAGTERFGETFDSRWSFKPSREMVNQSQMVDGFPPLVRLKQPVGQSRALDAIILLYLSSCRRTRHLALLRHLLRPFLGTMAAADAVDSRLSALVGRTGLGLRQLEGANFWFNRPTRDFVYSSNSSYVASAKAMAKCKCAISRGASVASTLRRNVRGSI